MLSVAGLIEAWEVIEEEGDLSVIHLDGGVPWQEAFEGVPFPPSFEAELDGKASLAPEGQPLYLAATPIAMNRDGLALYRTDAGSNQPLPEPWASRDFDDPEVVDAFTNFCRRLIDRFDPDWFAYAIEVNLLLELAPDEWEAFVALAEMVYETLDAEYPGLPIFVTLDVVAFNEDRALHTARIPDLLPSSDYVAVSAYPYRVEADPEALAPDYFTSLAALFPGRPFAIAETGWPAEDVTDPYPVLIPSTPERQRLYLDRLLSDAEVLSAEFVTWFFHRDLDEAWEAGLKDLPEAPLVRLFRDTGLFDGGGAARPAMALWRETRDRPLAAGS